MPPSSPADEGGAPLVSVVIPVFNQGEFVTDAIRSVLSQGYSPIELIVVDDGSTDDTASRLEAFRETAVIFRQPNRGAAAALNRGIRASHGSLVCWLSADDEFLNGKIEAQVTALRDSPEAAFAHTGYQVIDAEGVQIRAFDAPSMAHPDAFVTVFWKNSINGSTVMLRRSVFDESGGFDESLRADVDGDLWLRITRDREIVTVRGEFVRYRVHANALSANTSLMAESMTTVRQRHLPELRRRLEGSPDAPALLASMSIDFSRQGLDELAGLLLHESRDAGLGIGQYARTVASTYVVRLRRRPAVRRLLRPVWHALKRSWVRSPAA